jgi:hypothetical protein
MGLDFVSLSVLSVHDSRSGRVLFKQRIIFAFVGATFADSSSSAAWPPGRCKNFKFFAPEKAAPLLRFSALWRRL